MCTPHYQTYFYKIFVQTHKAKEIVNIFRSKTSQLEINTYNWPVLVEQPDHDWISFLFNRLATANFGSIRFHEYQPGCYQIAHPDNT